MAENSFKALFITFVLVAVFIVAMVNFAVNIQTTNDANSSILDNPVLNNTFGGLQTDLTSAEATVNASKTSFEEEKTSIEFGELTFKSIVGSGKKFTGVLFGVVGLIFGLISLVFPLAVLIGAIFTLITISVILFLWRLYKQGE